MAKLRVQVITRRAGDMAINHIVNAVYFDAFNLDPTNEVEYDAIAQDVRDAFRARQYQPTDYGVETKVYNMADGEPRPIRGSADWAAVTGGTSSGSLPREVALCLSYFSERNLPRYRGRLYIGPFDVTVPGAVPPAGVIATVRNLATAMANIGGINVDWQLYSPTRQAYSKITGGWVDNEWDTVRSRGLKATARSEFTTGE